MTPSSHLHVVKAWRGGSHEGRPGWVVHFVYDERGVKRLKNLIPPEGRQWDDTAKVWWISDDFLPEAILIAPTLEAFTAQRPLL